jgi:hypothetical protein
MNDLPHFLFYIGGIGWVALFFVLEYIFVVDKKAPLHSVVATMFRWLLPPGPITWRAGLLRCLILFVIYFGAVLYGHPIRTVWRAVHPHITGVRGICLFVLLPYALCGIFVYWFRKHSWRSGAHSMGKRRDAVRAVA